MHEADLDRLDELRAELWKAGDAKAAPLSHVLAVVTRLLRLEVIPDEPLAIERFRL